MKKIDYVILLIFILMFYVMNIIVPFYGDDYAVIYSMYNDRLITNVTDLLKSTFVSWHNLNGRFFCNLLMMAFPTLIGNVIFNILNTMVFTISLCLMIKLVVPKFNCSSICPIAIVLCGFYVIMLENGSLFFWGAGSANYLWSMAMSLGFLVILQYLQNKKTRMTTEINILILFSSFFLGLQHEMFVIPMSFSLLVFYAFNRNLLNKNLLFALVGFCVASLIVFASPGNFNRVGSESGIEDLNFMAIIRRVIALCKSLKFFYLFLGVWVIFRFKHKNEAIFFLKRNILILLMLFSSFAIPIFAGQGGRATVAIEVFSIIVLGRLIYAFYNSGYVRWFYGIAICLFVHFTLVIYDSFYKWNIVDNCQQTYLNSKDYIIKRTVYEGMSITRPFTINVDDVLNSSFTSMRLARVKADKLGVDSVPIMITIPENVAEMLYEGSSLFSNANRVQGNAGFYGMKGLSYYVMAYDSLKEEQIKQGLLYKTQKLPIISSKGIEVNFDPNTILISPCPVIFVKDEKIGNWILLNRKFKTYWGFECDCVSIHKTKPSNRFKLIKRK